MNRAKAPTIEQMDNRGMGDVTIIQNAWNHYGHSVDKKRETMIELISKKQTQLKQS